MPSMTGPLYIDGQYLANMVPGGRLFLVNTNDADSARNADRPWFNVAQSSRRRVPSTGATTVLNDLAEAIDGCVSSRGDRIVVARGYMEVTETIAFNKTGITVMVQDFGGPRKSMGEYTAIIAADTYTDGPVVTITSPCTIVGLGFVARDTGSLFFEGASVLIGGAGSAAPFGAYLYQCRFPKWEWGTRFGLSIEGGSDCLVEDCVFEGATSDFEAGIYLQGATANLEIKDNKFTDCDYSMVFGVITSGGPGPDLDYHGNRILGADSKGIDTNGQTGKGLIWGNYFNTAVGTSTFDAVVSTLETNGWICSGNNYKNEAEGP